MDVFGLRAVLGKSLETRPPREIADKAAFLLR